MHRRFASTCILQRCVQDLVQILDRPFALPTVASFLPDPHPQQLSRGTNHLVHFLFGPFKRDRLLGLTEPLTLDRTQGACALHPLGESGHSCPVVVRAHHHPVSV
jgi:hypothetical protein